MEKNSRNWHPGLSKNRRVSINKIKDQAGQTYPQPNHNLINKSIACKTLIIAQQNIRSELEINKWRYQTDYPILKIYHFSYQILENSNKAEVKVVYEVPHILLQQLQKPISLQNVLYIIKSVLMTIEKLFDQFGYFLLNERMIGFAEDGTCKLWVNEQFSSNQVLFPVNSEEQCVQCIKNISQKLIGRNQLEIEFIEMLKNERYTRMKLIQQIWCFSYQNKVIIPPYLIQNDLVQQNHKKTSSNIGRSQKYDSPGKSLRKSSSSKIFTLRRENNVVKELNQSNTPRKLRQYGKENIIRKNEVIIGKANNLPTKRLNSEEISQEINYLSSSNPGKKQQKECILLSNASSHTFFSTKNRWSDAQTEKISNQNVDQSRDSKLSNKILTQQKLCFREKSIFNCTKMNRSSFVDTLNQTNLYQTRKRLNSKSDVINLNNNQYQFGGQLINSQLKYFNFQAGRQDRVSQSFVTLEGLKVSNLASSYTNSSTLQQQQQQKKEKMKCMIKQKIRLNRQKKKVIKLNTINTVKSIGEFTQSEKRILEDSNSNININHNIHLGILHQLCNKVGKSQFHIQHQHQQHHRDDRGRKIN